MGHRHKHGERCAICSGEMDARSKLKWEQEMMAKHGYYIHAVLPERGETNFNVHTHGVSKTWPGQLDFQIVLPVDPTTMSMPLIQNAVDLVRKGARLEAGQEVERIALCPVRLIARWEDGREVVRIIFPDPKGLWPDEMGCHQQYAKQLEGGQPF